MTEKLPRITAGDVIRVLERLGFFLTQYQEITGTSRATAKRDLEDLVNKGLLKLVGAGRGAFYHVPKKRLINGSNGSSESEKENGS